MDDIRPGAFANMTRLVRLILTRNRISDLKPAAMAGKQVCDFYVTHHSVEKYAGRIDSLEAGNYYSSKDLHVSILG